MKNIIEHTFTYQIKNMKEHKKFIIGVAIFAILFWTIVIFAITKTAEHVIENEDHIVQDIGKFTREVKEEFNKGYNDTLK